MKVLTAEQMQALDRRAIDEVGLAGVVLMENAGRLVAEEILQRFSANDSPHAVILAGRGNNGGDGYVIARYLMARGWCVEIIVLAEREAINGDAAIHLAALENCHGEVSFVTTEQRLTACFENLVEATVVVDALFGTGLKKPVSGLFLHAIEWLNGQNSTVVAVDIPSGVNASTGQVPGAAVKAALTVSFAFAKVGLISYPGAGYAGEVVIVDIGIPCHLMEQAPSETLWLDAAFARSLLPSRPVDGHKGVFGHLLVVAGSVGKSGAAVMAAESGLRAGAGLVTLACPEPVQPAVAAQLTEAMTVPLSDSNGEINLQACADLLQLCHGKQALAIGPGMGVSEETGELIRKLIVDSDLAAVVDADGLTAFSGHLHLFQQRHQRQIVLTPHPGEMSRLTGLSIAEIEADRFQVARRFAVEHGVTLVLKGARTLIVSPEGQVHINSSGHAGMAVGGMGDVLTGVIGGLMAQGLDAFAAATLGVYLHGFAADLLLPQFGNAGLLASDLMQQIPSARHRLTKEN